MSDRVGRVAVLVVAVACLLAVTGVASAATSDPRTTRTGGLIETPFVPAEREPAAPREASRSSSRSRCRRSRTGSSAIRRTVSRRRRLRRRDEGVEGQGLVRPARTPARSSWRRSTTMPRRSPRHGSARRSPGRWRAGTKGSFGRKINEPWIWWPLCGVFFIGLANFRRPLSMRNLDLLVLLSFSASWWFFNEGEIFTSVPLAYPPLVYLLGRMIWLGVRAAARARPRRLASGRSGCSSRRPCSSPASGSG